MDDKQDGRIGKLPANINEVNPVARPDAKSITGLVREKGKVSGYRLSDGSNVSAEDGVAIAKEGGIKGVAVAKRKGNEYLRSLPDNSEGNNLTNLPSETKG